MQPTDNSTKTQTQQCLSHEKNEHDYFYIMHSEATLSPTRFHFWPLHFAFTVL